MTNFDIELRFKTSIKTEIRTMVMQARRRWLSIVKGGFHKFTTPSGKTYDKHVIDIHITPIDGIDSYIGLAKLLEWNHIDNIPVHTKLEIDTADIEEYLIKDPSLIYDSILHEMGHCIGIDRFFWDRHNIVSQNSDGEFELSGQHCREEYQKFAELSNPTNLPLEYTKYDKGIHIDEALFPIEIMSPGIETGGNKLSRLSVAMLADIGYEVDFSKADDYDAYKDWKMMNAPRSICSHSFKDPYASDSTS